MFDSRLKQYSIFFLGMIILSSFFMINTNIDAYEVSSNSELSPNSLADMKILAVIANGFGDAYFWIKDQLESWGCNVTTAGLTSVVTSCPNKPPRPVTADILIADVTTEILPQFDAVYVPAGPHLVILQSSSVTHDLLASAYDAGLVVSGICIGTVALAQVSSVVNGVKVAYYSQTASDMVDAGATLVYGVGVVSDKRVVTAGSGTFQSTHQAIYPFCVAIAKEVLGLSAVTETTISSVKGETNTTYTISVETVNLNHTFYGNTTMDIHMVSANVYLEGSPDDFEYVYLTDHNLDNIYAGNFTGTEKGTYTVDLEVRSAGWGMEVIRNAVGFKIKAIAGFEIWLIPIIFTTLVFVIKQRKKMRN
ncbi:MAG: DJ-1/PfpI family protein [Asgard group archaeon]|nr:DJ-1/PfpI family protein [Asgard group archaeon]